MGLYSRTSLPLLVVEDHDDTRNALVRLLHLEGYTVVATSDGDEALDYLHDHGPVGLIVMDLQMPRLDGWRLRRHLLDDPALAHIPVVVFSARRVGPLPDVVCASKNDPGALLDLIDRHARPIPLGAS